MEDESTDSMNQQDVTLKERLENQKASILAQHSPANGIGSKKSIGKGTGTYIYRDIFESAAFWSLSGAAPQMLVFLLGKRIFKKISKKKKLSTCINGDNLKLSYVELRRLGVTQPRASRGFDQLLARGFITVVHAGGGCQGDQSIYALSDKWRLWKEGTAFSKRPGVVKRGFQGGPKRSTQHTKP